jgi:hypothetical protein
MLNLQRVVRGAFGAACSQLKLARCPQQLLQAQQACLSTAESGNSTEAHIASLLRDQLKATKVEVKDISGAVASSRIDLRVLCADLIGKA